MINRFYNKKYLWQSLMWLVAFLAAMKFSHGLIALLFPLLALVMMYANKADKLLYVLFLMITCQVGNPYFFPRSGVGLLAIRVTMLLLAILMSSQLFGRRQSPILTPFKGMFLYVAWMAMSSAQGWAPVISYLKLALFSLIFLAYYVIANQVIMSITATSQKVRAVVLTFACLFLLGSAALIPFPGIGLMSADDWNEIGRVVQLESLFKGMTLHSQALGPFVSLFAVLLLGDMIFAIRRFDRLYVALLIMTPILVWKTSSRTALGTLLGGLMMVVLLMMKARGLGAQWKGKLAALSWTLGIVCVVVVIALPQTRQDLMTFALKKQGSETVVAKEDVTFDSVTSSRQSQIDNCYRHFKMKPIMGNGFQVSQGMAHEKRSDWKDYLTAPIEKGVWVTAVLEEGGVIGFCLFSGFLLVTFLSLVRHHAYIAASCLFTATLTNLGEFTFFSMSYSGGLIWAIVFAAVVLDAQRMRDQRLFVEWLMGNDPMIDSRGMWR